jgi:hypothetical protein
MLGALGKAFGGAGKAIGKGAKKGFMGMKDKMNAPQEGGIDTGPSPKGSALQNIMRSVSTAGQPDTARNQVPMGPSMPFSGMSGQGQPQSGMGSMNPSIMQSILQRVYGSQKPPMPTNPGTGQNMGYAAQDGMVNNPNMGVLGPNPAGMDVGPTMPMMNRRLHGMF